MLGATGFLNDFVKDEVKCRGLSVEDFGAEIDNEKNDIPLYLSLIHISEPTRPY